jgi:hypothetical protein
MVVALDLAVARDLARAVQMVSMLVVEVEVAAVVVATMVALGMVVGLARVQVRASIVKVHIIATTSILMPVVMEVVVEEAKLEVTTGLVDTVLAAEPVMALVKLVRTGMDKVMQMLMQMAMAVEKALVRMVVVAAVKVPDLGTVMQTHRCFTFEKMEPNLWCFFF